MLFITGMVGIGGLFIMGGGYLPGTVPQVLGALSVLLASVNVSGGFVITKRMLDMFKREFSHKSSCTHTNVRWLQVPPILRSIIISISSRQLSLPVDFWLRRVQAWLVSYKLAI